MERSKILVFYFTVFYLFPGYRREQPRHPNLCLVLLDLPSISRLSKSISVLNSEDFLDSSQWNILPSCFHLLVPMSFCILHNWYIIRLFQMSYSVLERFNSCRKVEVTTFMMFFFLCFSCVRIAAGIGKDANHTIT